MNAIQKQEIEKIVRDSLTEAEAHWSIGGNKLIESSVITLDSIAMERHNIEPSHIPGFDFVNDKETIVKDFIAFVVDMRNSSNHLLSYISYAKVSELQRVYYETSALLPALAKTIEYNNGSVTEYLGDGLLALFRVDEKNKWNSIQEAYQAAKNVIKETRIIVNDVLNEKYQLEPLNLGVGMAMSPLLVTLVGLDRKKQPKAIGQCIYKATKLSDGINQIIIDDNLRANWKKSFTGKVEFSSRRSPRNKLVTGYIIK